VNGIYCKPLHRAIGTHGGYGLINLFSQLIG